MATFTKQAIKSTFLKLLRDKPLNQISVKTIVENCGINRKSFYYYYQDLPDLIDEIVSEQVDLLVTNYPKFSSTEECLEVALRYLLDNKTLIQHIYQAVDRNFFEENLLKVCDYMIRSLVDNVGEGQKLSQADKETLITLYRATFFGLISDWLMRGMKEDVLESFHRMCHLRQGMLEEMLARCGEEKEGASL